MVMIEATDLISGTRARIMPPPWWKARIMASVPCPSASGAQVKTRMPEISPPTVGTSRTSHQGQGYVTALRLPFERRRHVEVQQAPEDQAVHGLKAEQERHGPQPGDEPDDRAAQGHPPHSRRRPEGGESLEALP